MKKIELIQSIKQQDLILANAVSKMVDYIQDKWAAPYPSKEQTEAVNDYLRSVHANGDGTMNETAIAHRKIATQKITINAIRVLDHEQLDRLQDVLNHIATDRACPDIAHYNYTLRFRSCGLSRGAGRCPVPLRTLP